MSSVGVTKKWTCVVWVWSGAGVVEEVVAGSGRGRKWAWPFTHGHVNVGHGVLAAPLGHGCVAGVVKVGVPGGGRGQGMHNRKRAWPVWV